MVDGGSLENCWAATSRGFESLRVPSLTALKIAASLQGNGKIGKGDILGGVAEWSMAAVLKTVERQRSGGSNPSASAKMLKIRLLRPDFSFWIQGIHPKETKLPR